MRWKGSSGLLFLSIWVNKPLKSGQCPPCSFDSAHPCPVSILSPCFELQVFDLGVVHFLCISQGSRDLGMGSS